VVRKARDEDLGRQVKILEEVLREERRRSETLKTRNAFLEKLLDFAPEAIVLADSGNRITRVNRAFTRLFGYTSEEALGKTCDGLIATGEKREEGQEITRRVSQGEAVRVETVRYKKDGTPVFVELMVAPIRVGQEHIGDYASYRNITERKQMEEKLRESESKFRAAFEGSHDALTLTTRDGRFVDCNRRALELFGLESKKGFTEKRPAAFSPPFQPDGRASSEAAQELIRKVFEGGRIVQTEWIHQRKSGGSFPAEIIFAPLRIGNEEVLQATIRDIKERKRADEEKAVFQDQLRQSQKMEAIGQLAGGIAHDFNNLLTVVIGNAEMALMDLGRDHRLYTVIEEVKKAGQRASNLTRQLLAFSRKQILQPEILSLNEVVLGMKKMLQRVLRENIELETRLIPDLGLAEADRGQMEQIIVNLAVNARDAMPSGGTLTIETANVDLDEEYARAHLEVTPGSYVMLAVSDSGIGMTKDVQERLFEPFFTTKGRDKGTGLGLATVYGIVKQSKGSIWVYSEPGRGAAFKIYLPRVKKAGPGRKQRESDTKIPRGSETVIVVEDDETVRKTVLMFLKKYGYTVLSAATGKEGLAIFRAHKDPIHLLLTDMVMPGLSGKDLATQAKRLRPDLKVLYMSGYTDQGIANNGIIEKGIHFIQKPFTHQELATKVREVIERKDE